MPDKKLIQVPKGKIARKQAASLLKDSKDKDRTSVIKAVTSPLNFFALCVLAVEVIIGIVAGVVSKFGVKDGLTGTQFLYLIGMMVAVIILLILVVAGIAILKPTALSPEMGEIALKVAQAEREAQQALKTANELESVIASPGFKNSIQQIVRDELNAEKRMISAKSEDEI